MKNVILQNDVQIHIAKRSIELFFASLKQEEKIKCNSKKLKKFVLLKNCYFFEFWLNYIRYS